jgi:aerobic-type carbon monoxide dehydrogenase small subunit (CoxS/CutS family)
VTRIEIKVNGENHTIEVEPRRLLADVLRQDLGLSGVHIGCAHGACGACTVWIDEVPQLSCLTLAVQCDGKTITTVESLGGHQAEHPLQKAFRAEHGLQCGFCTPGFLMAMKPFVDQAIEQERIPEDAEIRSAMGGNICRCTGYQGIVAAVRRAVRDSLYGGPS